MISFTTLACGGLGDRVLLKNNATVEVDVYENLVKLHERNRPNEIFSSLIIMQFGGSSDVVKARVFLSQCQLVTRS